MRTSIICTAENFSNTLRVVSPGGKVLEAMAERHVQTVGKEGDEDVRLDAVLALVVDPSLAKSTFN